MNGDFKKPALTIPALVNLHSHAFQRGFAGLTETRTTSRTGEDSKDSFWSWRELMYRFANRITPETLEAIATWLYIEMLEAGYSHVCEFHYLHHAPDGTPYLNDAELSHCLIRAARTAGIGLTLLPVLYQTSGFGGTAPKNEQRRFVRTTDALLKLIETLRPLTRVGLALHSLRAVSPSALADAVAGIRAMDATAPIHIHIAEQQAEVDACLARTGQRPVAWLLDHTPVDAHWCLVHATHMTADEICRAAATGAVAGICPSTEANLGDGVFDLPAWENNKGVWGIGSDSHVCVNAAEELMFLEYSQRLKLQQRNVAASQSYPSVATHLFHQATQGGLRAAGLSGAAGLTENQNTYVTLDSNHIALTGLGGEEMLAAHVFASGRSSAIDGVWVNGTQRVFAGRHPLHVSAKAAFMMARKALLK